VVSVEETQFLFVCDTLTYWGININTRMYRGDDKDKGCTCSLDLRCGSYRRVSIILSILRHNTNSGKRYQFSFENSC
jgi:hypothetical protein